MPRIRTTKPTYYRHEELSDLESACPERRPMLVFQALWGHADKRGVFEWKPRQLALDILPFVFRDHGEALGKTLALLWHHDFIVRLTYQGKEYGWIPTLPEHQRFSGKEAKDPPRYPDPKVMEVVEHPEIVDEIPEGNDGEALGKQQGSTGESKEGKGVRSTSLPSGEATRRKRSQADPRSQHPAIQAVREITARYPDKTLWDAIIDTLGETFDGHRLRECWKAWRLKGFSPTNYSWITEWYANGITNGQPRASPCPQKPATGVAAAKSLLAKLEASHDDGRGVVDLGPVGRTFPRLAGK
jgi:hypothetical protein